MSPATKGVLGAGAGGAAAIVTDTLLRVFANPTPVVDEDAKTIKYGFLWNWAPLLAAAGGGVGVAIAWIVGGKEAGLPAIAGAVTASAAAGLDTWSRGRAIEKLAEQVPAPASSGATGVRRLNDARVAQLAAHVRNLESKLAGDVVRPAVAA